MKFPQLVNKNNMTPAQVLVFGYFTVIIIGTLLLMLPFATSNGQGLNIVDALFTATSATCVTGLIVVNTSTAFTVFGQLVIMVLIQIGGLGIMTMSTMIAFVIGKKITLKERLIIQEDLNQFKISGLVRLVRYVIFVTVIIEGLGALLLFVRLIKDYPFMKALYYSIFHAISAFNNAGFDLFGNSLENYTGDILMNFVVMGLIVLGGLGFAVLAELYQIRNFKKMSLQSKIVLTITLILIIAGFLSVLGLEYNNPGTMGNLNTGDKILSSLFLSITPRTAGFNTVPTGNLKSSTLFLLIVLMFIGASPGSTGGGIKTTTFGVLLITVWSLITGKRDIEIYKRRLDDEIIFKALAITMLSLGLVVAVTMILTVTEKMDFLRVFFESVSAFGTVGLSTGITSGLSTFGRILITITMFSGRVGPLTLAIAFAERKHNGVYHYPKEKIMVG
ncbi:TrkH family potassium uptake protein [Halothermothrix orenii]|uniref:Potassium uptake protein, TrkH family n=1 Tax=Halothermothrix orenii (strain H 168 / OCM 544 / DSM 9562) TaxID=373903 RepID=B8CXA2_HALOH|nr:TrkH family potassium uptake protein [Halothermothrix orenii]ACL69921.1 potassium uptake protein, TrkH family [Halothermothrix orenii H 168]